MTAVEFLIEQFEIYYVGELYGMGSIFDKAKEMEEQQIMDAFNDGINDECLGKNTTPEQYYNSTFKKDKI